MNGIFLRYLWKKKNKTLGAYTHYFFLFCVFPIKLYLCYKFTPFSKNWNGCMSSLFMRESVLHESMPHLLKKTKIINMFFLLIPTGKLFGLLSTIKLTEEYFLLFYFKIRTIFYGGNFRSPETKLARNWHKNLYSCLRVFNMVSYFVYVQILAMYLNERKKTFSIRIRICLLGWKYCNCVCRVMLCLYMSGHAEQKHNLLPLLFS